MISYRCVIEVLKWTDAETVLHAAVTSQVWSQVCDANELWHHLLDSVYFHSQEVSSVSTPKDTYRVCNLQRKLKKCILADNTHVSVYDCIERKWTRTWTCNALPGSKVGTAVLLPTDLILFSGGHSALCTLFHMKTGLISPTASMLHTRSYHSAILIDRRVYVFGGYEHAVRTAAETFNMSEWTKLPDMTHGKCQFNVCAKGHFVYLCGLHSEMFDTSTATYAPLPYSLQPTHFSLSFLYLDELISITDRCIHYHASNTVIRMNILPQ